MTEETRLKEWLEASPLKENYEIVEIKSLDSKYSKLINSMEEALDDFDKNPSHADMTQYILRLIPKVQPQPEPVKDIEVPQSNYDYLLKNAAILYDNKDFSLAKKLYLKILQEDSKNKKAIYGLARSYEALNDLSNAEKCVMQVIAFQPCFENFFLASTIKTKLNKDFEAISILNRAFELDKLQDDEFFELFKAIGNCHTKLGDFESAEENYFKALKICPKSDKLLVNLGTLEFQRQDYKKAQHYFETACETNPLNERAFCGLGMSLWELGEKIAAYDLYVKSLEISADNLTAIYNIVKSAYELKKYAPAEKYLNSYLELYPQNVHIMFSLAGIYYQQSKFNLAKSEVEKVLIYEPAHKAAIELQKLIEKELSKPSLRHTSYSNDSVYSREI